MIRINLLRRRGPAVKSRKPFPIKAVLGVFLVLFMAGGIALLLTRERQALPGAPAQARHKQAKLPEKVETPFDVVEDIVDDIHGGRFKVRHFDRLSSPVHLSATERKVYDRLFVKNAFDAFNGSIRPGMGFNTITLDNEGNFFIYGVTESVAAAQAFREAIEKSGAVLKVDELAFDRRMGETRTHFAVKGFLSYAVLDRFYEDDRWSRDEIFKENPQNVLSDLQNLARERGITWKRPAEWGDTELYGVVKAHTVRLQVQSTYAGLMKWINDLYELNLQIGFCKVNLTSLGSRMILSAVECKLYARN